MYKKNHFTWNLFLKNVGICLPTFFENRQLRIKVNIQNINKDV